MRDLIEQLEQKLSMKDSDLLKRVQRAGYKAKAEMIGSQELVVLDKLLISVQDRSAFVKAIGGKMLDHPLEFHIDGDKYAFSHGFMIVYHIGDK